VAKAATRNCHEHAGEHLFLAGSRFNGDDLVPPNKYTTFPAIARVVCVRAEANTCAFSSRVRYKVRLRTSRLDLPI